MRNIINSAGLLKAQPNTMKTTNSTGRTNTMTHYNPEIIKKILSKQNYSAHVINYLATMIPRKGISSTAKQLGVKGYNRGYSQQEAKVIREIHNPEAATQAILQKSTNYKTEKPPIDISKILSKQKLESLQNSTSI